MSERTPPSACPVCRASRTHAFNAQVLSKYDVDYFFCPDCGLLQTESPHWLVEAYGNAIIDTDTDIAARNTWCARRLSGLLYFLTDRTGRFLDVAGGYGLLTRIMRDVGFDYFWSDPYCTNLFARGFEAGLTEGPFEAISAFEVLEHVPDPVEFLDSALRKSGAERIFFTTQLFEGPPPAPSRWDYYAVDGGQHISFYRISTLERIARRLALRLYTDGRLHMLSRTKVDVRLFRLLASRASFGVEIYVRTRMRSRTTSDRVVLEARARRINDEAGPAVGSRRTGDSS